MTLTADDRRHGTHNGYNNYGCRCDDCRAAWTKYHQAGGYTRRYRERIRSRPCKTEGCDHVPDVNRNTGHCHRCNIDLGLKPA